ncbi:hypothetical protein Tco_0031051 [Tanacetum coccineum]
MYLQTHHYDPSKVEAIYQMDRPTTVTERVLRIETEIGVFIDIDSVQQVSGGFQYTGDASKQGYVVVFVMMHVRKHPAAELSLAWYGKCPSTYIARDERIGGSVNSNFRIKGQVKAQSSIHPSPQYDHFDTNWKRFIVSSVTPLAPALSARSRCPFSISFEGSNYHQIAASHLILFDQIQPDNVLCP